MHFHFNLRRNTRFMQRIENICSSFSYFFLSLLPIPRIFLTYLSLLPLLFLFLYIILHRPSLLANIHGFAYIPSETKLVGTDRPRTSVSRISFTLASSKERRHGRRRCASKHSSFRFAYERERERVTSMAIKWTMLTIHQFSISWNFNGTYNIAASCASTKGSRPS